MKTATQIEVLAAGREGVAREPVKILARQRSLALQL